MSAILKYFRSLGMIQQMNLMMIPIFIIVISCFVLIQIYNINYTGSHFSQASTSLLNSQNNKSICIRLERVVGISRQLLNINSYKVQSINLLYNKSFENIGSNQSIKNLPLNATNPSYYKYPVMSYYPYGNSSIEDYYTLQFINFTSVLNSLILAFDQTEMISTNNILLGFNSSAAILAAVPIIPTIANYNPLQRSWYLKQVESVEKYGNNLYVSNIYYSYSTMSFVITVQNSLIRNGFRGVVGINFDFKKMQTLLSMTNDNVVLIYENGTILFQNAFLNYFIINQTVSVFDENITGFNEIQWDLLKVSASQSQFNNIIVTYNTVFKKQMTINIHKFTNLPYYLMLFANLEEDKISNTLSEKISYSLYKEQIHDLTMIGSIYIGLLTLLSISITIILRPIKRIKWLINHSQSINQTNTMFLAKRSNNQLLDLEFNLIKLILRMKKSSMIKSNLCTKLESFRWPRQQHFAQTIEIDDVFDTNEIISNRMIISKIRQCAKNERRRSSGFDRMSKFSDRQNCELFYSFFTTS